MLIATERLTCSSHAIVRSNHGLLQSTSCLKLFFPCVAGAALKDSLKWDWNCLVNSKYPTSY